MPLVGRSHELRREIEPRSGAPLHTQAGWSSRRSAVLPSRDRGLARAHAIEHEDSSTPPARASRCSRSTTGSSPYYDTGSRLPAARGGGRDTALSRPPRAAPIPLGEPSKRGSVTRGVTSPTLISYDRRPAGPVRRPGSRSCFPREAARSRSTGSSAWFPIRSATSSCATCRFHLGLRRRWRRARCTCAGSTASRRSTDRRRRQGGDRVLRGDERPRRRAAPSDPAESDRDVPGVRRGVAPVARPEPVRTVSCLYTSTRGSRFVIDRHPEHGAVLIVSACSGHGFKHSPAIGEAVAQWLETGRQHHHRPEPVQLLQPSPTGHKPHRRRCTLDAGSWTKR